MPCAGGGRVTEGLQIVHSDLGGPISEPSRGGALYFGTFAEEVSCWTVVVLFQGKRGLSAVYKKWLTKAQLHTESKIRVLRYDHGGEDVSNALKALHDEHGARHRTAVPDTPQQNNPALRLDLCSAPECVVSYSPCSIQIDAMVEPPTKARSVLVAEKKVAEDAEDVEEVSGDDIVENELSLRSASDGESVDADDDGKDDKQNDQSEQSADVNQGCGGFEDKLRRSGRAWRPRVESWNTVTLVAHNAPMT